MSDTTDATTRARRFLEQERAFRLGSILTESQHPATRGLAERTQKDTSAGIGLLQRVDRDLPPVLAATLRGEAFRVWESAVESAIGAGRKLFFTGCGATGRLSILLEACWRKACERESAMAGLADRVFSVMAGGDFALIKSVEGYEDFQDFGRRQINGLGLAAGDVVTAVTEGGETSFVIGTAWAGVEAGAQVFFVYNNPDEKLLPVERSARVIGDGRITKINLTTGPMAVAGSTRMQATTIELAVLLAGLERVFERLAGREPASVDRYVADFSALLDALESEAAVSAMAGLTDRESALYGAGDRVLYLADARDLLLDILTDTTERSPTFSLPPFARSDQPEAPRSWSFVKDPGRDTPAAWEAMLGRPIRGIDWTTEDYIAMEAPESIVQAPPALDEATIRRFEIGREPELPTPTGPSKLRVLLLGPDSDAVADTPCDLAIRVGRSAAEPTAAGEVMFVPDGRSTEAGEGSSMRWSQRLAAKIAMNTVSTATMAKIGRLVSNWMVHVTCSNKKLIDRGVRLLSDQANLPYDEACVLLFESIVAIEQMPADRARPSPVAHALERATLATNR